MTAEERAEIVVTARLLRSAAGMQWLAIVLTILAAAAAVWGRSVITPIVAILFGLIAVFYGFRVSFDAKLFEDVATQRLTTPELDTGLDAIREGKGDRSWADRCRGARGLVVRLAMAVIAQLLAVVLIRWS